MTTPLATKHILIVEDFAGMRAILRDMLRSLSVTRCDQAASGKEALGLMESFRPDIVLCDYNLGDGKNGQQVLEEAREKNLIGIDSIFVMLTAENRRDMVLAAVEYFPDGYLTKPFSKDPLKRRLEKLIELKSGLCDINDACVAANHAKVLQQIDALLSDEPPNPLELLKIKADALVNLNRFDEALPIYHALLPKDPRWAHLGMSKALFKKKDYAKAEEVLGAMIEEDRYMVHAYDLLGKVLMAQGRFREAEDTLGTAVALSPRAVKRQIHFANTALHNGNAEAAEAAFRRAAELAAFSIHNHPSIHCGLSNALIENGKHAEAENLASRIERNFPKLQDAKFFQATAIASIRISQGDLRGAREAISDIEQEINNAGNSHSSRLALEMFKVYSKLGQQDKATRILQRSISNNHDNEDFLAQVGHVCTAVGMADSGKAQIAEVKKKVIRINNTGFRLIKKGDFDAAIKLLREAAQEMPRNLTVNLNAAKAMMMKMEQAERVSNDDIQIVRDYIRHVRDSAPNDWRLQDISSRLKVMAFSTTRV